MYKPVLAAALSGASLGQLRYWRKNPPVLEPEHRTPNRVLYSYRDVVALRSLAYLRQRNGLSLQKIRVSIRNLRELGMTEHLSSYKLIQSGRTVIVVDGDEAIDLLRAPGNSVIAELVDVFDAFDGRVGAVLPFQEPVPGVIVDPAVRSGMPVVAGTRVSYDQVAALMDDDVAAEDIRRFFPRVTAEAARAAHAFAGYVREYEIHGHLDQVAG